MTTQPITPLRQRMLDDMKLRNMAKGTRRIYVPSVADFSAFHGRSPDELTLEDVRDYQLHLVARGLKASTICQIMSALRFLYAITLDRPEQAARIPLPRKADPLPAILSPDEVARLLAAVPDLWMRALLTTVYAAGLRVSEAVALQVTDIDSARMTIRVREGKGGRDRYVMLSPQLLAILRAHWRRTRSRLLAVPGAGPLPADHGAHGAARLPRGGRGRRARQVGHRAHAAALLRHPPAGARRRHPGDPGPAGPPAYRLDHALRPGRAAAPSARSRARSSCSTWEDRRRPEPAA